MQEKWHIDGCDLVMETFPDDPETIRLSSLKTRWSKALRTEVMRRCRERGFQHIIWSFPKSRKFSKQGKPTRTTDTHNFFRVDL